MNGRIDDNRNALDIHRRFYLANLPKPHAIVEFTVGQEWRLRGKRGHQTLFCLHGSVWVTQESDIRDYIRDMGDAVVVTLPGLVLVKALSQAIK